MKGNKRNMFALRMSVLRAKPWENVELVLGTKLNLWQKLAVAMSAMA